MWKIWLPIRLYRCAPTVKVQGVVVHLCSARNGNYIRVCRKPIRRVVSKLDDERDTALFQTYILTLDYGARN